METLENDTLVYSHNFVSEGLNSVETKKSITRLRIHNRRFQKDLIVWKLALVTSVSIVPVWFQKDLIVWKPVSPTPIVRKGGNVSEGLNSVETYRARRTVSSIAKFQKDLIVWKPRDLSQVHRQGDDLVSEGLNSVETMEFLNLIAQEERFQKDLIVWKPRSMSIAGY